MTLSESPSEGYGGTSDALAYNHFLQGRALYDAAESTQTDLAALSHFEQAIVIDRSFGAAHAALARTLTVLGNTSVSVDAAQSYYDRASSAAGDALR